MTEPSPTAPIVVDAHAHLVPDGLLRQLHQSNDDFPHVEVTAHESTFRVAFNGGVPTRPIAAGLTDRSRRWAWLDDQGIDLQLTSLWLDLMGYELPPDEGAAWAAFLTQSLRAEAEDDPQQVALGTVPLQDPLRAAESLRSLRADGLPGVMIATRAGGRELSDPELTPFWEAADETQAVVFLHPGFGSDSDRYRDFGLVNGLGRLEDTTVSVARLLYAGIPARHSGARLVVAHGGAALPYVLGRLAQNHVVNSDTTCDPWESFTQLYFDSVVFDSDALNMLVTKVGADHVLLGSDYPFPIGDLSPRKVLDRAELSDDQRALINGENARRLFMGA